MHDSVTDLLSRPCWRGLGVKLLILIEHRRGILALQNWTSGFCEPMFDRKRKPLVCVLCRERQQEMFQKRKKKHLSFNTSLNIILWFLLTVRIIATFPELWRSLFLSGHSQFRQNKEIDTYLSTKKLSFLNIYLESLLPLARILP